MFKGHAGGVNLEELKKEVVKGQGCLNPSNKFVAGLFGKTDVECIVDMDHVPPHTLCDRIEAATDTFIDKAGGDEPVQFHSRQLGFSWLKHAISNKTNDGGMTS